jgi:hypothetical protein
VFVIALAILGKHAPEYASGKIGTVGGAKSLFLKCDLASTAAAASPLFFLFLSLSAKQVKVPAVALSLILI